MQAVTEHFAGSGFKVFAGQIASDPMVEVWAIPAPTGGSRAFCDRMKRLAQSEGQPGLGYIFFRDGQGAGPIAKISARNAPKRSVPNSPQGCDAVFFICGVPSKFHAFAGAARTKAGTDLNLVDTEQFAFCWIVDFPIVRMEREDKKIDFSHNPFSYAARWVGRARKRGSANHQCLPVRYCVQWL